MDPELQQRIDSELTRYKTLNLEIQRLEQEVSARMRSYEELLNSYLQALEVIQPKMESWRAPRRREMENVLRKLSEKWSDLRAIVRADPKLDQDEQLFQAVIRLHYKKLEEQKGYQKRRRTIIDHVLKEIPKITL
jgi:Skp family chaperone for outer membrane proteins